MNLARKFERTAQRPFFACGDDGAADYAADDAADYAAADKEDDARGRGRK